MARTKNAKRTARKTTKKTTKKTAKKTPAKPEAPTPERQSHDGVEKSPSGKWVVRNQRQIDRMFQRNQITREQYDAANDVWRHWYLSGLEPRLISKYDVTVASAFEGSGGMPASERQAHHRKRLREIIDVLTAASSDYRAAIIHVVCHDATAEQLGNKLGHLRKRTAQTEGMATIRAALDVVQSYKKTGARGG